MAKRRYIVIQNRRHMTYSMMDTTTNNSLFSGFPTRKEAQTKADEYEKWQQEKSLTNPQETSTEKALA